MFVCVCSARQLTLSFLLLLFRHSAKSLNVQEERLATSHYLVTRLHPPHAIAVRLYVRKSNVVILTPETAGTHGAFGASLRLAKEKKCETRVFR